MTLFTQWKPIDSQLLLAGVLGMVHLRRPSIQTAATFIVCLAMFGVCDRYFLSIFFEITISSIPV
jgi:hypothetical protein